MDLRSLIFQFLYLLLFIVDSAVFLLWTCTFKVRHPFLAECVLTQVIDHTPIAFCHDALAINRFAFTYLHHAVVAAISCESGSHRAYFVLDYALSSAHSTIIMIH